MGQLYQDLMAVCCKYGAPSLFITRTANPNWPEVKASIPPGAKAYDHPVQTARAFRLKEKDLIHEIVTMGRFGKVIAYTSTIEFQKRGLPHLHLMVTLDPAHRPVTPKQIALIVSAEIPDPADSPRLHALFTEFMLHGPCGGRPCWQAGACNKGYPRPFTDKTVNVDGTYPVYKRRDTRRTFTKLTSTFDNRSVVPYNEFLTLMFECHINVEIPVNTTAIKYLFKYITKGHYRSYLKLGGDDEIQTYINARYISPPEGKPQAL
jgi:hypothetical protein